jgi:GxxExxY protein
MNTNRAEVLLFTTEVFQIVGCATEVLNTLGHGLLEKPYKSALVVEFGLRKIPFRQQSSFDVLYKGRKVGVFVPDLIAFDSVVVDTRAIERVTDHEHGLMLNYLRITGLRVSVILNFKPSQTRMGEECFIKFESIRVHSWLMISHGKGHRLP